jgi:hypothetical protein
MKRYFIIIVSIIISLSGCGGDELDRTIFIPDESDSNLPAYTEMGYNSFGAKYERKYFISSNDEVPCKITYREGRVNFILQGYYVGNVRYNYYNADKMVLLISIPFGEEIKSFEDLLRLHQKKFNLADRQCRVEITSNIYNNVEVLSGSIEFKRAQLLRLDRKVNRVILSGVFELRFLNHDRPESISDGRFDVGINNDFYYYP